LRPGEEAPTCTNGGKKGKYRGGKPIYPSRWFEEGGGGGKVTLYAKKKSISMRRNTWEKAVSEGKWRKGSVRWRRVLTRLPSGERVGGYPSFGGQKKKKGKNLSPNLFHNQGIARGERGRKNRVN